MYVCWKSAAIPIHLQKAFTFLLGGMCVRAYERHRAISWRKKNENVPYKSLYHWLAVPNCSYQANNEMVTNYECPVGELNRCVCYDSQVWTAFNERLTSSDKFTNIQNTRMNASVSMAAAAAMAMAAATTTTTTAAIAAVVSSNNTVSYSFWDNMLSAWWVVNRSVYHIKIHGRGKNTHQWRHWPGIQYASILSRVVNVYVSEDSFDLYRSHRICIQLNFWTLWNNRKLSTDLIH